MLYDHTIFAKTSQTWKGSIRNGHTCKMILYKIHTIAKVNEHVFSFHA